MCLNLLHKQSEKYQKKSAMNVLIEHQMEENFLSMKLSTDTTELFCEFKYTWGKCLLVMLYLLQPAKVLG